MRYYLVGGAVRDLLLGVVPKEFDWVFDGPTADFLRAHANSRAVGRHEPVYLTEGCQYAPLRGTTLARDLALRDFTINALALEESGVLHAHPLALADLQAGILRPASSDAFARDPARVFRAARFAALLPDFTLHPDTLTGMRQAATEGLLASIAAERVGNELQRAMQGPQPGRFLRILSETGCLSPWLTELAGCDANAAPERTATLMDAAAALCGTHAGLPREEAPLSAWMALCHDLGRSRTPRGPLPRPDREDQGELPARALCRRLRLPARWEKAAVLAAGLHGQAGRYARLRPSAKVDLLVRLHKAGLGPPFAALAAAHCGDTALIALLFADIARILAVSLPVQLRGLGPLSGEKLRQLRCRAFIRAGTSSR